MPPVGESRRLVEMRLPEPGPAPTPVQEAAEAGLASEGADWVVEALAAELANGSPPAESLLAALYARAGYESADPAFDSAAQEVNARLALLERLLARGA
jgi:hypothetical protein